MANSATFDITEAYWLLAGDPRDFKGSNDLQNVNAVPFASGGLFGGSRADLTRSSQQYFRAASNATFQTGDIQFGFSVWVELKSKAADMGIVAKWGATPATSGYRLYYDAGQDRFVWEVSDGTSTQSIAADLFGSPAINTRYHISCIHDSAGNAIEIWVNGIRNATAHIPGVTTTSSDFHVGTMIDATNSLDGFVEQLAFFKGNMTQALRRVLFNSGRGWEFPFGLRQGLVALWALDEFSDGSAPVLRKDSPGNLDLTDNNTLASRTGLISNAGDFDTSGYLSRATEAALEVGDNSFTVNFWSKLDTKGALRHLMTKNFGSPNIEWIAQFEHTTDRFRMLISPNGSSFVIATANSHGPPPLDTWEMITGGYRKSDPPEPVTGRVSIRVNAGTEDSTSSNTGPSVGTADFAIGANQGGSNGHDGGIDEAGLWNRELLSDEITLLYNGGSGLSFQEFTGAPPVGKILRFDSRVTKRRAFASRID